MTPGYSGTPLAKKLGIKPGNTVLLMNAPAAYRDWLGELESVTFTSKPSKAGADVVHLFAATLAELESQLPSARKDMKPDGMLWVSWYKKSAKMPGDLSEDAMRNRALKTDLVDVKVCAVSDVWSGLKLVVRRHLW